MRCDCTTETPKGISYHPAVKAVYWRVGLKGHFKHCGYKCPKCKKWYDL
jgi:hypothetical protein